MEIKKFCNQHLYTDVVPYEVVRVISEKTIEIREMKAVETNWGREFIPGGWFGHTTNQDKQKWLISSDETKPIIRARFNKPKGYKYGFWRSKHGRHHLADEPIKFYDYNY